jgi:hypothetical protein
MKGVSNVRAQHLFEMFDGIPSPDKILCDELAMALRRTPFRTHQTKGRGGLPQTLGQDISCLFPQAPIAFTPILTFHKDVSELHD